MSLCSVVEMVGGVLGAVVTAAVAVATLDVAVRGYYSEFLK
jgi:hypothetical protein